MSNDYYQLDSPAVSGFTGRAAQVNDQLRAIEEGFAGFPDKNDLASSRQLLATETASSAANAYIVESAFPITVLRKGMTVEWFPDNTNTGASRLKVDATPMTDLKQADGADLVAGAVVAGRLARATFDGTFWQLENPYAGILSLIHFLTSLPRRTFQQNADIEAVTLPEATGGSPPYVYSLTGLPSGLQFAAATRRITGNPTVLGESTVTYTVTDSNNVRFSLKFIIHIVTSLLEIPALENRLADIGQTYNWILAGAVGGRAPYEYSISGLPDGFDFEPETRTVSGSPLISGSYNVRLSVKDADGQVESRVFAITVGSPDALTIPTIADRVVETGSTIGTFALPAATGGTGPFVPVVTGLPAGLKFNSHTLEISGTVMDSGVYPITYRVIDSQNLQAERKFTITASTSGHRITAITDTLNEKVTVSEIQTGNIYAADIGDLFFPAYSGNKVLNILQAADRPDLTVIGLGGVGNAISDFEKKGYTVDYNGLTYAVWAAKRLQGPIYSEAHVEVR